MQTKSKIIYLVITGLVSIFFINAAIQSIISNQPVKEDPELNPEDQLYTFPINHMDYSTPTSGGIVNINTQIQAIHVEENSYLRGKTIDTISLFLSKKGDPNGSIEVGIFDRDRNTTQIFGNIKAEEISHEFKEYVFSLPSQTYRIMNHDIIGIKFLGGDESNYILVMRDLEEDDIFDGENTELVTFTDGWNGFANLDLYMILSQNKPTPLLGLGEDEKFDPETFVFYHTHNAEYLYDDFSDWPFPWNVDDEGSISPNNKWVVGYNGGGFMDVLIDETNPENNVIVLEPEFVENETRAPLALTTDEYEDFILSLDVRTDKQLRPENPNPWEMAWVKWRYVDETHFYYFTLKPNGAECGKYDGGVNPDDQLYICDSKNPTTYLDKWDHWDIIVKGDKITILVNGKIVHHLIDVSSFKKGKIGLYNEDARTSFDNIFIRPI